MPDPLMDTLDEIDRKSGKSGTILLSPRVSPCNEKDRGALLVTEGTSLHVITVIFGYRNLGKPLKILKFSWVSSPSHLVLCYIVLPLFMNPHKGKNKGKNQLRKHCF